MATEQEAAVPYPEWRERYREGLRQDAEAATLEKLRRGEAVGRLPLGYEYGRDGAALLDASRERPLREAFLLAAEGSLPCQGNPGGGNRRRPARQERPAP